MKGKNIIEKIKWTLQLIAESRWLRYVQIGLNFCVFFFLILTGTLILRIDKILGSMILLMAAMHLILNKVDRR